MLQIVALPVQLMLSQPGPKYSTMQLVPPLTVKSSHTFRMTSLALAHPLRAPVSFTPMKPGLRTSHGIPTIASTASAPPTPTAIIPSPPAFTVWLSVPIIRPPGKA